MAAIYLDNLVKPEKVQSQFTNVAVEPEPFQYTYKDLHLDVELFKNIGNGLNSVISNDISSDYDIKAIQNSIYNIFTTRPGEKLLTPSFGCSLEQFLFQPISDFRAQILGNLILTNLTKYEPRIIVNKVLVKTNYNELMYEISVNYQIPDKGLVDTLQMNFNTTSHSSVQIL
jgi:phage baseplate assembly protein W